MKITRLLLKDVRCFDELELKLDGRSALIIGDNGDVMCTEFGTPALRSQVPLARQSV